jgi:pilus assembly protein Flp/PilA
MNVRGNKPPMTQRRTEMIATQTLIFLVRAWRDRRGQDLIEYALMAGFVAVAAGAIMPNVATSISTIFSQISSVMSAASTQS